jgi:C1A family cysteine protease
MKKSLKKSVIWFFILFIVSALNFSAVSGAENESEPCTIMQPDRETRFRWIRSFEEAPKAYLDEAVARAMPRAGSYSLLSHLDYIPAERSQGSCGNCWAWAGTGVMEVALDRNEGIFDRLSVQYNSSCGGTGWDFACCGGWLSDVVDFYTSDPYEQAIPWSNTNASWEDGGQRCSSGTGSTTVPCGSIATSPKYTISHMQETSITTHGVSQATAIQNIKNVLHQGKAVWFAFFLATGADWDNFRDFWRDEGETEIWNPDFSCGHTEDSGSGGHAVLCVGYNDIDPDNPYWIMVNSWGTAGGDRPNGLFRLDMDMNYECTYGNGGVLKSFFWQTLDITYDVVADICECDLNQDENCDMLDWLAFGVDWGRTDCGTPPGSGAPPNDCECDINLDGNCDMLDWLAFGVDWGRTDCPLAK